MIGDNAPCDAKAGRLANGRLCEAGRRGAVPDQFEMVVNRKAATALGLAIPLSIRLRGTEVIE